MRVTGVDNQTHHLVVSYLGCLLEHDVLKRQTESGLLDNLVKGLHVVQ